MSVARRRSMPATLVLATLLATFVALAATWIASRARRAESPRWTSQSFAPLRTAPGAPVGWDERWVVAVHPGCPHCATSLASLAAARERTGAAIEITALIVDAARAPSDSTVARLPADETCWDASGRWRARWRHGVYGEVLCFDARGALLRTIPPFMNAAAAERRLIALGLDAWPD